MNITSNTFTSNTLNSIKYKDTFNIHNEFIYIIYIISLHWFCNQIWLELINNFKKATIEGIIIYI